jgi:hypothetical protein
MLYFSQAYSIYYWERGVSKLLPNHELRNINNTFWQTDFWSRCDNISTTLLKCYFGVKWIGGCVGRKPIGQVQKIESFKTFVTDCHTDLYSRLPAVLDMFAVMFKNKTQHDALAEWRTLKSNACRAHIVTQTHSFICIFPPTALNAL